MASRRRRRKGIGKVITSVERKVRRIEKRPGAKRLKTNVVTTDKILPRAIVTKKIDTDAVTANEAAFGVPVITDTQPTENLKEGTLWVNPDDGAAAVYSTDSSTFIGVTDATAQTIAASKNTTYVQANEPTGGTYSAGDLWIDIDDGNKLYAWSGTAWVARQDGAIATAQATADGKNTIYRQTTAPTGGTYATGDLWFDTDDNNKIYRYNGTNWNTAVQLGGNALANVNANTITAGTIDASVITVSNINAGNISTGILDASIITVRNAVGSNRIELNNLGLFAYQSNVATVSITNTGTAVFSGTVNANGGNFTGYVTGGTMRFGATVQTGKNGIYINASNYWYDTGEFQLGSGTAGVAFNPSTGTLTIGSTASIAGTAASTVVSGASSGSSALQPGGTLTGSVASSASIAGTTASTVVSGAAEGATALQEGNGVTKNGSDQIVTIGTSTGTGIRIGTAPTASGNTARVEINSGGFFAYNGSEATVSITSAGNATFKGNVTGSTFTSTNYDSGTGLALAPSGSGNTIFFNVSGSPVANITTVSSGLVITSGSAQLTMTTVGAVVLTSSDNSITLSSAPYLNGSGANTGGSYGSLRNIFASSSAPSPTSDPGAPGGNGDVWLRWA